MSTVNMKPQDGIFAEYGACVYRFPRSMREAYVGHPYLATTSRSWKPVLAVLAVLALLVALMAVIHLVNGGAA